MAETLRGIPNSGVFGLADKLSTYCEPTMPEPIIRIWDGPPPMETGAPGPLIFCDGHIAYVAYGISSSLTNLESTVAILRFEQAVFLRFGHPGEDDLYTHPLYQYGLHWYSFHIIEHSPLIQELGFKTGRHWFIAFHDESLEIVAEKASVILNENWASAEEALWDVRRVIEPAEQEVQDDLKFYQSLGPEIGPEVCTREECNHKRIALSVKCIRHHFEMVKKKPCPL